MPPHERATLPAMAWPALLSHARQQRIELRCSLTLPFTHMQLVPVEHGCRLYALGTLPTSSTQTILATNLDEDSTSPVVLDPIFSADVLQPSSPSTEFSLLCERQRAAVVSGVSDYAINVSGRVLLMQTGDRLYRMNEGRLTAVQGTHSGGFVSDAQICPCDAKIVSYVFNKQLHIERDGELLYQTKSTNEHESNGIPAFIAQEELDRYKAVWWSPTKTRLLYERVDESQVKSLTFACPGKEADSTTAMKYPLAGTPNATSELRLVVIGPDFEVSDVSMKASLQSLFPWIEYIARVGFLNDGKTIWVQVLCRQQKRSALIVIPECEFEGFDSLGPLRHATIVYEEEQTAWINTHNAIVPLDGILEGIQFIYASEMANNCHLYLVGANVSSTYSARIQAPVAITSDGADGGVSNVCKVTRLVLDQARRHVYYVSNVSHPTEWNVCVASFGGSSVETKRLTEEGISYRGDRSPQPLAVVPDVGFVCWMSSVRQPPQCRFYRLVQSDDDSLPEAQFIAQICINGTSLPPWLTAVDAPRMLSYTSRNSGYVHYAIVMKPAGYESGRRYPVLHYVYGGPGIQLVRNDYGSWVSFQKYTKLGFVVVLLDARGSANRGLQFEAPIWERLGEVELEDQVEGLQAVAGLTNGMMDLDRVIIHGWSYGGYMSLLALAKHPNIFKACVAGGSVTSWSMYDTAYAERYLGYPLSACYSKSSILHLVDRLPDTPGRLLILHGFIDENVHFRHVDALVEALIKHGKPYQLQVFPSERHGVRSADAAAHLDATMMHFMFEALRQEDDE